ncbi:hypothetical protein UVI_02032260 [Ustilaginoidea virens]|uniref:Uncharacterized protein n=1 Tax=Ustilaginoidea virens TaxID=1159556 RepID=A0A1B5KWZ4_USTVR|nr:hypothetical protein UVI_02032260 [Ustilaginoidea virens]
MSAITASRNVTSLTEFRGRNEVCVHVAGFFGLDTGLVEGVATGDFFRPWQKIDRLWLY